MSESVLPKGGLVGVTGANGYIASHIVKLLLEKGYRVRGFVRDATNQDSVQHLREFPGASDRLELLSADLHEEQYTKGFQDCIGIIHCATPYIYEAADARKHIIEPAVNGARGAIRAAQRAGTVKRFVFTSSGGAIFHFPVPEGYQFTANDWNTQCSETVHPYFYSKRLSEEAIWEESKVPEHVHKPEVTVINPLFVVGPPLSHKINTSLNIVRNFLMGLRKDIEPGFVGLVDVRDVAVAHVLSLERAEAVGKRIFVCGEVRTWKYIADVFKYEYPNYPNIPDHVVTEEPSKSEPTAPWSIDTSQLCALGFNKFTPIRQSLRETVDALVKHGIIPDMRGGT